MHIYKSIFFSLLLILMSSDLSSDEIEEIIVKGNLREAVALQESSSIVILNQKILESQPIKHFENLSYLIPNLNFADLDLLLSDISLSEGLIGLFLRLKRRFSLFSFEI